MTYAPEGQTDDKNLLADKVSGSPWTPAALRQRFCASLRNTSLIGDDSYLARYRKVQWCMNLWRFLVAPQLLLLILVAPDRFGSLSRAYAVSVFLLAYTTIYAFLVTHTRAGGSRLFHTADLLIVIGLFFVCDTTTLLFDVVFYSEAVLLSLPSIHLRELLPRMLALSTGYLIAENLVVTNGNPLDYQLTTVILFFIWGFGFLGFSSILERVSTLELDARLDEYRRSYRRRLHDDLGNTLCGLHFKIQSLRLRKDCNDIYDAFGFIQLGYRRAGEVIRRLLAGIDTPEEQLDVSLGNLVNELRLAYGGIKFELNLDRTLVRLSHEVQGEIFRIIREAVMNALQHAAAQTVSISSGYKQGRLLYTISDDGRGFDISDVIYQGETTKPVSFGLQGMRERAANMHARLEIESQPGAGTRVALALSARKQAGFLGGLIQFESAGAKGGLYHFLVRIMLFVWLVDMIRVLLSLPHTNSAGPMLALSVLLTVPSLCWVILQNRVFIWLSRWPWLLALQQLFFACLFAAAWRFDIELFFEFSFNFSVIISAYFLGIRNNFSLSCLGGILVTAANFIFPATGELHSLRMEIIVTNVASNIVFALTAGLAVEFVKNLEEMQFGVVSRVLARQRERLTAATHQELSGLINSMGEDIGQLGATWQPVDQIPETIRRIEKRSTDLKQRLRKILRSLDEPLETGAALEKETE